MSEDKKQMQFGMKQLFFIDIDRQEKKWQRLIDTHIGLGARLLACSESSTNRRIYEHNGLVYKIATSHEDKYSNTLYDEFKILQKIKDINCVPEVISYKSYDDCSILVLKKYFGDQIGQFGDLVSNCKASVFSLFSSFMTLNRVGLRHGDAHFKNILFLPDGNLKIVDFDQATFTTPLRAFMGDFLSIGRDRGKRSVGRLLAQVIFARLPALFRKHLRLGAFIRRRRYEKSCNTSGTVSNSSELMDIWQQAAQSDSNAPGVRISYYSLRYGGVVYKGERAWESRWASINSAVDFKGKRLLELGCNLGLLSCYAQQAGALAGGMAVDYDEKIIDAAKKLAQFVGVEVAFRICDFDLEQPWENEIPVKDFRIVSALSVLNWLKNKERFLKFLSQFSELIYEGHDSLNVEVDRLQAIGFSKIQIISVSERGRVVLLASK
jgi:predicted Ser/Thr protein kinase